MRVAAVNHGELMGSDQFTCDDCGLKHKCAFVYDGYNTNGDCLADK